MQILTFFFMYFRKKRGLFAYMQKKAYLCSQLGACSQIGAPCSLKKDYQSLFSKKYPPCPYIPQNATVLSKGSHVWGRRSTLQKYFDICKF